MEEVRVFLQCGLKLLLKISLVVSLVVPLIIAVVFGGGFFPIPEKSVISLPPRQPCALLFSLTSHPALLKDGELSGFFPTSSGV